MRWLLIVLVLLSMPLFQGCAGFEIGPIVSRAVQFHGKYCKFTPDVRATLRTDVNGRLEVEYGPEAWVFVHCPADPHVDWKPAEAS